MLQGERQKSASPASDSDHKHKQEDWILGKKELQREASSWCNGTRKRRIGERRLKVNLPKFLKNVLTYMKLLF